MPTGRVERRVAQTEVVELVPMGDSAIAKVEATTENVSSRGARVITNSICAPGKFVRLEAPNDHVNVPAQVIYCQPLEEGQFAVGLQFDRRGRASIADDAIWFRATILLLCHGLIHRHFNMMFVAKRMKLLAPLILTHSLSP